MVTGSNPYNVPVLQANGESIYITDFRVEIYTPPYLAGVNATKRPTEVSLPVKVLPANGSKFNISFTVPLATKAVTVVLMHGGYVTHSLHMGARMLVLDATDTVKGNASQKVTATMPPTNHVAPPGPYVLHVVADGIPSVGQFVMVT